MPNTFFTPMPNFFFTEVVVAGVEMPFLPFVVDFFDASSLFLGVTSSSPEDTCSPNEQSMEIK